MTNEELKIQWYVTNYHDCESIKCLMLVDPYGKEFCCSMVHGDTDSFYEDWGYDKINELSFILSFLFHNTVVFIEKK